MNISTKFREYQAVTGRTIYYRADFPSRTAGRLGSLLTGKVTHPETRLSAPFPIARDNSSRRLSMSGHRSDVICSGGLFSCRHTGQDSSGKKSNLFFIPVINLVIPIALVDAVRRFISLQVLCVADHDSNRSGEFLSWVTNLLSRTTK